MDIQRNRILTTSVLKQAESLADDGMISTCSYLASSRASAFIAGKLAEAQAALNDTIKTLQSSLSKEEDLCKVIFSHTAYQP